MKKLSYLLMWLLLPGTVIVTSCTKDDDDDDSTVDKRMESVIPSSIREQIKDYIPIYDGKTPPNVEGTYYLDPEILIGSTLSNDKIGKKYNSEYQKFSDQDMNNNTINMVRVQGTGTEWMRGSGAFISGSGNNFTIYFNMKGENKGIMVKEAIVLSGTKTSTGVKDLTWGFVLKEKGDDPSGNVVPVGTYRFFKDEDGMSEAKAWPYGDEYDNKSRMIIEGIILPNSHSAK